MNDSIIVYRNPLEKALYEFYSENPMALVYIVLTMMVILFLVYIYSHIQEWYNKRKFRTLHKKNKDFLFH